MSAEYLPEATELWKLNKRFDWKCVEQRPCDNDSMGREPTSSAFACVTTLLFAAVSIMWPGGGPAR